MLLENVNVLRGPNYWSIAHPQLIVMQVNIPDRRPVNQIPGFTSRYRQLFGNSVFDDGGENMLLPEVIERTAVELQRLAGVETIFRKTVELKPGIFKIIFSYCIESAGKKTADVAFHVVKAVICDISFHLKEKITEIRELIQSESLGPSTNSIYTEAVKRGIPALRLDNGSYVQLGYGSAQKRFEATLTSHSASISVDRACNKHLTKQLLAEAYIPVPKGTMIGCIEELYEATEECGYPLVIKPLDGNQGKGATINITNYQEAEAAFIKANTFSDKVIVEQFVEGHDFRALVINNKFVAAAMRKPAAVTGNGIDTIGELVEKINKDPRRGEGHCNVLTKILIDDSVHAILKKKHYTIDTIPAPGEEVLLRATANLSTGGTAEDVTDNIHPLNISLFERIARIMGLDICGIDMQAADLSSPIAENGGAVIEVNAAPGFRMHLQPSSGQPRNVAAPVIDMLFPDGNNGRIPIVAVTGTNGKTTTTRLIARMVQQKGFSTGFTTTDGIYLNNELIYKGDCSGPASAKIVLRDPSVEFAVLECARGGIIRSGLGFDQCDCAVVTNIAEDHLGLGGIETIDELARVKAVVARSVMPAGYAVLNADDDLVYRMKNDVRCNVALFSVHADNPRIERHCEKGGIAAVYDEGYVMIREGNRLFPVEAVECIPLTHDGRALFNIENVLGATLAAYVSGITLPAIRCTLRNFRNSPEDTPGRLNQFKLDNCHVLVDYAHNTHGLKALGQFVTALPASKKIGVITAVGDRRNEDIISLGAEAAGIFDEIIIRYDEDLRGRTEFEIGSLLRSGILQADPDKKIHQCADEIESIDFALRISVPDTLIVLLVENAKRVAERLRQLQQQDAGKGIRMAG